MRDLIAADANQFTWYRLADKIGISYLNLWRQYTDRRRLGPHVLQYYGLREVKQPRVYERVAR